MGNHVTKTPEETMALGEKLGRTLRGGELIAFTGGLGAGKTTFCRGIAKGLCVEDAVSSPTFTIVNYYRGATPLAHFDAWRINGPDDLETSGFYDYLEAGAVVAVEWSERLAGFMEPADIAVEIGVLSNEEREIAIKGAKGL